MTKQSFMVCATYRSDDNPSPLRYFGILSLIEDAMKQSYDGEIRVAIVDSSPTPHPFFTNPEALLENYGIAYIHAPSRDEDAQWRQRFPDASKFAPTDEDLKGATWSMRAQNMKDWDDFLLFEKSFKEAYKGPLPSAFMHMERPAIGMKKNIGVAALTQEFGPADNIVFCDDDDRHHPDYVATVDRHLQNASFARPTQWLSLVVGTEEKADVWGEYNVPFYQDTNGNWCVPAELEDTPFHSTMKTNDGDEYVRTIGEKFSTGMRIAFPPLSHDGALHSYRYDMWQRAVENFGGCGPTSMCEDMLFYRMCMTTFQDFKAVATQSDEPLFIRCADGSNASLIEWNIDLNEDHGHTWAQEAGAEIYRNLRSKTTDTLVAKAGDEFLKTGQINWDVIFPQPKKPAAKLSGPNKAKGPL